MRFFIFIFILIASASGAEETKSPFAGLGEMNGLRFQDYADFHSKWHLVTVRYRKDTNEQRLTYANDSAWSVLKSGKKDYPDGAAFGKIGFATEEDPVFPSSAVPSGSRRYQLMVKDSKKYSETDGWGYALFDKVGTTLAENPATTTVACHACHRAAKDRGYVFSQAMNLDAKEPVKAPTLSAPPSFPFIEFEDLPASRLPAAIRTEIPLGTSIRSVKGVLRDHLFQGTLDEIRPQLAKEAARSNRPAALLSRDGKFYSIVFIDGSSRTCSVATPGALNMIGLSTTVEDQRDPVTLRSLGKSRIGTQKTVFCQKP